MRTPRDQNVINFLEEFNCATTSQLYRMFFKNTTYRYCCKRLLQLVEQGELKRSQASLNSGYAYFLDKKPVQMHHNLIRTEIYINMINMQEKFKILQWANEVSMDNIRPDAVAIIEDHDIPFTLFIEVHTGNWFDFNKYKEFCTNNDIKALFGITPRVIICTDRNITVPTGIPLIFKIIGFGMNGLDNMLK